MKRKAKQPTLNDFFQHITLASGTPANFQKKIAEKFPMHSNSCSMFEAIGHGWILKPVVNLIHANMENNFPAAIRAVFMNEHLVAEEKGTPIRIIVNARSIDEIKGLEKHPYFSDSKTKLFHLVAIHTTKVVVNEDGYIEKMKSTIDGEEFDHKVVIDKLQNQLDAGTMFNDDLPVIIFQVDTISEGINLKSCSATIVTSTNERTVVQQMGRVMRLFEYANGVKKDKPNVYIFQENREGFCELFANLLRCKLTADCFTWGRVIDERKGSGDHGDGRPVEMEDFVKMWEDIDNNKTPFIEQLFETLVKEHDEELESYKQQIAYRSFDNDFFGIDEKKYVEFVTRYKEIVDNSDMSTLTGCIKTLQDINNIIVK